MSCLLHLCLSPVFYLPVRSSFSMLRTLYKCEDVRVHVCVFVSVSISPWQHSSPAEPVRGLCLTSLFNQTQTHTSGQPGPRYLSPASQCQMHTPCTLPRFLSPPPLPAFLLCLLLSSGSTPLYITLSPSSSSFSTSCVLLLVPLAFPLLLPTPLRRVSLSPRDVTFSTDSGAAASKLGQSWLKMCARLVWRPCTNLTVLGRHLTWTQMCFMQHPVCHAYLCSK